MCIKCSFGRQGDKPTKSFPISSRSAGHSQPIPVLCPSRQTPDDCFGDSRSEVMSEALVISGVDSLLPQTSGLGRATIQRSCETGCERAVANELMLTAGSRTEPGSGKERLISTFSSAASRDLGLRRTAFTQVGSYRQIIFLYSRVALCSLLEGRSASRAIRRHLLRLCPCLLAGGIPSPWFTFSRYNVADPPSRDRPDDDPCRHFPWWELSIESGCDTHVDVEGLFGQLLGHVCFYA